MSLINNIRTERLLLKVITPEVATEFIPALTDEDVTKMFARATKEEIEKFKDNFRTLHGNVNFRLFIIHDPETDEMMGSCNFHTWIPKHLRAEIGYVILEEYRRKGVAKEAMKAVLTHGFEQMGINRVEAFVGPMNEASLKLVNHYGFTKEGLAREHFYKNGKLEDSVSFSLLKREYDALKSGW